MTKGKVVDWERIEADYRAGVMTLREIAGQHGITEGAIRKRAKRDGWERDLGAKIAAKADALVRKDAVRSEVRNSAAEQAIVEANAQAIAEVKLRQRHGLRALLAERERLLAELTAQRDALIPLEQAAEILASIDERPASDLRRVVDRAVGLGGRASILKSLAEIDAKLVPLERQAWGMDAGEAKSELETLSDEELDRRIDARLDDRPREQA